MRIGILETGHLHPDLQAKYGIYKDVFERFLTQADPALTVFNTSVVEGELPGHPTDADGWVVTGSRHGVYDDLPWMGGLKAFLRECLSDGVPVVGICFGHQILADAMGGQVVKSEKGWGLGVHDYVFDRAPAWMTDMGDTFAGHAVHQDQVVKAPVGSMTLAQSAFCPHAVLAYGSPDAPDAISIQSHPEFTADFVTDLIDTRLAQIVPEDRVEQARSSLGQPVDNANWARWITDFLRSKRL